MSGKKENSMELEPELAQVLAHFRTSVHAWSEAANSQPRQIAAVRRHFGWRLALGGALSSVLAAGTFMGIYAYHHGPEGTTGVPGMIQTARPMAAGGRQARATAGASDENELVRAARDVASVQNLLASEDWRLQQEGVEAAAVGSDDDLLAAVDSDVARQIPRAMEPLAQIANAGQIE
jgi:hypothetical protein